MHAIFFLLMFFLVCDSFLRFHLHNHEAMRFSTMWPSPVLRTGLLLSSLCNVLLKCCFFNDNGRDWFTSQGLVARVFLFTDACTHGCAVKYQYQNWDTTVSAQHRLSKQLFNCCNYVCVFPTWTSRFEQNPNKRWIIKSVRPLMRLLSLSLASFLFLRPRLRVAALISVMLSWQMSTAALNGLFFFFYRIAAVYEHGQKYARIHYLQPHAIVVICAWINLYAKLRFHC